MTFWITLVLIWYIPNLPTPIQRSMRHLMQVPSHFDTPNSFWSHYITIASPSCSTFTCSSTIPLVSLWHPGQLCTTSCAKTSQSMQKWLWHTSHAYLPLWLMPFTSPSAVSPFCCAFPFPLGISGKAVKHEKHALDFPAKAQGTSTQFLKGKRWW